MLSQTATLKYAVIQTTSLCQSRQSCETTQRCEASLIPYATMR